MPKQIGLIAGNLLRAGVTLAGLLILAALVLSAAVPPPGEADGRGKGAAPGRDGGRPPTASRTPGDGIETVSYPTPGQSLARESWQDGEIRELRARLDRLEEAMADQE